MPDLVTTAPAEPQAQSAASARLESPRSLPLRAFWPMDGKGWRLFLLACLPVLIEGIKTCQAPRDWWVLPFALIVAGLNNTQAYHSDPPPAKIGAGVSPFALAPAPATPPSKTETSGASAPATPTTFNPEPLSH